MERLIQNLYQRVPIIDITLPAIDEQDTPNLLKVLNEISSENPYYIKTFLSSKLFKIETIDQDEFYELFSNLIMSKPKDATETDLVRYNIDGDITIKINETPRLISGSGTTGLRTWEAALYLSNYLATKHQSKLRNKRVLELGTGTGLVGITLVKLSESLNLKKLILTDGNTTLIESLRGNLHINDVQIIENDTLQCQSLWWGQDDVPEDIDVIVAADVTYDSSIIPALVSTIRQGIFEKGAEEALIAATIRNEETISVFEEVVAKSELKLEIISRIEKPSDLNTQGTLWYSKISAEIRIYRITKP